jgi:tetratricopeptide (TPR) repeat protein
MTSKVPQGQTVATDEECRAALSRIMASTGFVHSERLRSFLTYIVEETIAGREALIRGKTIAMDVYGRDPTTSSKSENVVRVDARRLRRGLMEYYATEGKNDPICISVDSGGYAPRMEIRSESPLEVSAFWSAKTLVGGAAVLLATGGIAAVFLGLLRDQPPIGQDRQIMLERQALREKSPLTLQAVNLAEQARGLLFPLLAPERQRIATDMFRQAIHLDPDYFGGYAGAAQTLTTLSKMMPPGSERDALLAEAADMAKTASQKNPTHSWVQSASGWAALGVRDFDRALELSRRAVQLSPEDGDILDFHAAISLFTGNFDEALQVSDPARPRSSAKHRFANRNLFGVANFHLGFYEDANTSFQRAAELGDPISAPSLMYQAAAHQALGHTERARELQKELFATWPNFRPEIALLEFYQHQVDVDQILDPLGGAGWNASD